MLTELKAFLLLLLLLLGGAAEARVTARGTNVGPQPGAQLVQSTVTTFSGNPGSSLSAGISGVTAGNALVVAFDTCMESSPGRGCNDCHGQACITRPITSITGSGGTCARAVGPTTGYHPIELWACTNATAGAHTIVLNLSPPTGGGGDYVNPEVRIMEVTANTTAAIDGSVSNGAQNVFGTGGISAAVSTSGNVTWNDFIYSVGLAGPFTSVGNPGPPWNALTGCGSSKCEVIKPGASFGPYTISYNNIGLQGLTSEFDAAVVAIKAPPPLPITITGVTVASGLTFPAGAPTGTSLGPVHVSMIGPPFTGTLALSGADVAKFQLTSTTLPSTLQLNGTQPCGVYHITLTATQSGAAQSPMAQPLVINSVCGPTVVQDAYNYFGNGPETTGSVTLSGVGAGHAVVFSAWGACGDVNCTPTIAPALSGVTATGGTCALVPGAKAAGGALLQSIEIWLCTGVGSGTVTVNATYAGNVFYAQGVATEIKTFTSIDTGVGNAASNSTTTATETAVSTAVAVAANGLLVATANGPPINTPIGWTTSVNGGAHVAYKNGSSGVTTADFGVSATGWVAAIAGFK